MPRLSGKHAVMAALLLSSVAFLLYSLQSARPRPGTGNAAREEPKGASQPQEIAEAIPFAVPDDVSFSSYQALAKYNMFSDRRSGSTSPGGNLTPLPPLRPLEGPTPASPTTEPEPTRTGPDFTGWSYTGYAVIDGKQLGLLQNDSSDSYEELAVGDSFLGATVTEITSGAIRLKSGSSVTTLTTPELFPLVPLDKPAGEEEGPRRRGRAA